MLKKMSAARRAAFLRALAASGNATLSAERAKVSRSWVLKARRADPEFDAACEEALRASFARLGESLCNRPGAKGWGHLDGMELVVRGSNRRRVQIARARVRQFSPRTEDRFLAVLAATCSVKAACEAAGMSKGAAYDHRKRWPGFARRWGEAIEQGTIRLQFGLMENASNMFSSAELPPAIEMPPMRTDDILHNLYMHQHASAGIGRRPGLPPREPGFEEARRAIIAAIDAIEAADGLGEEVKARDRKEWARRRGTV